MNKARGMTMRNDRGMALKKDRGMTLTKNRGTTMKKNRGMTMRKDRHMTLRKNKGMTPKKDRGMTQKKDRGMKMTKTNGMKLVKSSMDLIEIYKRPNPEQELQGVMAAIGSTLLAVGGIALIVLSGSTLAPAIGMAVVGTGISSTTSAIMSTAQGQFVMLDWTRDFSINAGTSFITLGAGFGTGGLAGIALTSTTRLSGSAIKAIATAGGSLAGAGVRTGTHAVIVSAKNEPLEIGSLVIEGVTGAMEGATGAYLAAKIVVNRAATPYKILAESTKGTKHVGGRVLCKRSIIENQDELLFHHNLPSLPSDITKRIPSSFKHMTQFEAEHDTATLSQIMVGFIIVVNLMKLEHPKSKPFYQEICETNQLTMTSSQCMSQVLISIQEYAKGDEQTTTSKKTVIETLLDGMLFNTKIEAKNINQTHDNITHICTLGEDQKLCKIWLNSTFARISTFSPEVGGNKSKNRVKRSGCTPEEFLQASNRNSLNLFRQKHGIADDTFNRISQQGLGQNTGNAQELLDFRPGTTNHILKATDAEKIFQMDDNGYFKNLIHIGDGLSDRGQDLMIFETKQPYDFFLAHRNGIVFAKNGRNADTLVVSVTADDLANHHMIGNYKNTKDIVRKLKNGEYYYN